MTSSLLLYAGSVLILIWGMAHIFPTRSVVNGFGPLSTDNRRIITMEWVAEGLALIFIGGLTLLMTILADQPDRMALLVYRLSAAMMVTMAGWTAATGARTAIIPMKICPMVKIVAAGLIFLGSSF